MPPTRTQNSQAYLPIHKAKDDLSLSDIFGFLPYNRRIRNTKDAILHWNDAQECLEEFYWYVVLIIYFVLSVSESCWLHANSYVHST